MNPRRDSDRPWRTTVMAVGGLLVAVAVVGVVGILINRNIHQVVERAIAIDVELEDRADDLRVAVLDVRHYHRDLLLNNPTAPTIDTWEANYAVMLEDIGELEEVASLVRETDDAPALPNIGGLRTLAEDYHAEFRRALEELPENRRSFERQAEDLLESIFAMEDIAEEMDALGEQRAAAALRSIDDASANGTLVLFGVLFGLGGVAAALGIALVRLVAEQRRLVVAEQAASAEQAEAALAKTNFVADASHELRTPLTVLRGNAEIGLALGGECEHTEILREIVDESVRMSRLVDDLLFLARSDAATAPLDPSDVAVATLNDRLAARAEVLARERDARLVARMSGSGTLNVDAVRIEQAAMILVDNATKYGPPEGTVELSASALDGHYVLRVEDRGPGIPLELRSRVFERFYRVDAARGRRVPGAGLGLAIAAAIVDGHRGEIRADTREGGGTRMELRLPLVTVASTAGPVAAS